MIAAAQGLLARRWRVVAGAVAVCFGVVVVWGYLTPKQWQASVTVHLDPLVVPGLREDAARPTVPGDEEAVAAELAATRSEAFRAGLAADVDHGFTLRVERGSRPATLRFTARADSAERSVAAAYSAANGFLAWGRVHEAVARRNALQREVEAAGPADPTAPDLTARLAVAEAAVERLADGGGRVVVEPVVPDDPVSPDFTARLLMAIVTGLVAGIGLAWWLERRDAAAALPSRAGFGAVARTDGPGAGDLASRPRARALVATVAVLSLALPAASVLAAVVGVWELRPSTNAQDEAGYACLPGWLDDLPDGTSVAVTPESPRFFADHLQEFAFPRLVIPRPGTGPDVWLRIAAGPGPDACGGYHRELSAP